MRSCVDLNLVTLDGPVRISTLPGSKELPLLLAAYSAVDASSRSVSPLVNHCIHTSGHQHTPGYPARYMWQDTTSVQDFIQKLPDEVHCLLMSYSGDLRQVYVMQVLSSKRAAFTSYWRVTSATVTNNAHGMHK